jgi:hypothetical protein
MSGNVGNSDLRSTQILNPNIVKRSKVYRASIPQDEDGAEWPCLKRRFLATNPLSPRTGIHRETRAFTMASSEETRCNGIPHKTRRRVVPLLECVGNSQDGGERGVAMRDQTMLARETRLGNHQTTR